MNRMEKRSMRFGNRSRVTEGTAWRLKDTCDALVENGMKLEFVGILHKAYLQVFIEMVLPTWRLYLLVIPGMGHFLRKWIHKKAEEIFMADTLPMRVNRFTEALQKSTKEFEGEAKEGVAKEGKAGA